jgi:dienelactone hydrolase
VESKLRAASALALLQLTIVAGPGALCAAATPDGPQREDASLATELARAFGEPSSPTWRAADAATREALARFFLRGPGATSADGAPDAGPASIGGAGGTIAGGVPTVTRERVPGYPGLFQMTMSGTGSGFLEKFLLQVPDVPPSAPRPLLVAFHKYGTSHADVLFNTSFVEEARARGWYLIAPLGAMQQNFGCLESQVNVRAALEWARAHIAVDDARIYGVGFSMGGGGCASFAARHLDPDGPRLAAIVNHSGTVSLGHAWANENDTVRAVLEARFGGTPAQVPFAYQRCSTIDLHPQTGSVVAGTDMGRNLVQVHTWLAADDPDLYLPAQTQAFHAQVQWWHPSAVLTLAPGDQHSWGTLDEAAACDWLAQHAWQEPTSGSLLADSDGVWHRFVVEQAAGGAFTQLSWGADPGANRLVLSGTRNLRRAATDATTLGLAYAGTLRLDLDPADGSADELLLTSVPYAPNAVFRDGLPASATYDSLADTLLLVEPGPGAGHWVVVF